VIPFADTTGRRVTLACPPLPAPLHFAAGLLRYPALSLRERVSALAAGPRLVRRFGRGGQHADVSVAEALRDLGQGAGVRRALWDPLTWATLNANPARASARLLAAVVERALLDSREGSRFLLPSLPLSELYAEPARKFVEARGGEVRCRAAVTELRCAERVAEAAHVDGVWIEADAFVLAVTPPALRRLAPWLDVPEALDAATPIVTCTLWLDRPVDAPRFAGLLDAETQWVFQAQALHGAPAGAPARLACLRSGADAWLDLGRDEIVRRVLADVQRALPGTRDARLRHAVVVKEKSATLAPDPALQPLRPSLETALRNVVLAGDWTDTGLPATLESAALSGHRAADRVWAALR
jgi:squalene-associated FAD-dependent desaturase